MTEHLRHMGRRLLLPCLVILVFGYVCFFVMGQSRPSDTKVDPRSPEAALKRYSNVFYGTVEDQDGKPIEGAEVFVTTSELVSNPATPGGIVPKQATQTSFSVFSAKNGAFILQYAHDHNQVVIDRVEKEGYDWVYDWAWTLGPPHNEGDNRLFVMPGRLVKCPYYEPDSRRPIVLPMHRKGDPKPVGKPSRGGFEVDCNGKKTANERTPVHVPTTGPDAPKSQEEMEAKLKAYLDSLPN